MFKISDYNVDVIVLKPLLLDPYSSHVNLHSIVWGGG